MYFKLLILYNQHSKTPKTFHLLSKFTRNKPKILKFKDAISRFFDENKKWTKLVNRMWSNGSFYIYDIYVGHQHFFIAPSSQTVRFTGLSGKQQLQLAAVGCYSDVLCCPLFVLSIQQLVDSYICTIEELEPANIFGWKTTETTDSQNSCWFKML